MHKLHVTTVALLFAAAAVLGAVAVARTTGLGAATRHANQSALDVRERQLTAYAAKLGQELRAKPPALPALPNPATAASAPARVVYRQPPPVVVTVHHHGDDGSHEDGGGHGGDG